MIKIIFQNVGQGDSIILEWEHNGKNCIGLIDCHIYEGSNPSLDHLNSRKIKEIDFIILSHFHFDHYSGMADIFEYCIVNNITVKNFYHTFRSFVFEIYNRLDLSKKVEKAAIRFSQVFIPFKKCVLNIIEVSPQLQPYQLTNNVYIKFLSPSGHTYFEMDRQLSRKVAKIKKTALDINRLSTMTIVEGSSDFIMLCSDSIKTTFRPLNFDKRLVLVQVPHHGSILCVDHHFWKTIKKKSKCPAVFSVGNEPKDKLPNKETVELFDTSDFEIFSTNNVYGIQEYYNPKGLSTSKVAATNSKLLNLFSSLPTVMPPLSSTKFSGDQTFEIAL